MARRLPDWAEDFDVAVADFSAEAQLVGACEGVDAIVHLAAMNAQACAADPVTALVVNSVGTARLLRAAQWVGVRRFIYVSTGHIYGAPLSGTIDQATLPRPVHPYAISHRAAEDCVLAARNQGLVDGLVLRLSNGFGVPADVGVDAWMLLVNDLCRQAVIQGALTLATSGVQLRDFITLTDVGRGIEFMLGLEDWGDGLFNIGGEMVLSIYAMAERIARCCDPVLGYTPEIRRPAPSQGESLEPLAYRIDKLKATGFRLASPVDEEIDATLRVCEEAFAPQSSGGHGG